jgi:hypothetical protein
MVSSRFVDFCRVVLNEKVPEKTTFFQNPLYKNHLL